MGKGGFLRRWRLRYHYFKRTGFYTEVGKSMLNFLLLLAVVVGLVLIAEKTIFDIDATFDYLVNHVPRWLVFLVAFGAELLLGLIPSDLFIIWSEGLEYKWLALFILASMSYLAGILTFGFGKLIRKNKKVNAYFTLRFEKYIRNTKKWGSWLVAAAALTPLPFTLVMAIVGMMNYPTKRMLLWSSLRIPRYFLMALIYYHTVNIGL
ncbi:MAG: hypothetical protein A2W93_06415 [Bacteroidetes bacterium GWF2_43_63]|nr:MAG: hypothetical protein A2W94_08120 [Bacteroidetes bacterium GWE2_42_42]OFY53254.1 MAG: hypothetical protein A2W93_06415 [Bacteroidetes bacterium GWF2_43_63]HBG71754.1 hypothetical protein [Bacteroidales bacterium]HCB61581.1 hypothetical protein [Bacteroidales bacterium]HCY22793.1 hypothetical protein [Bacteroidales bacterium]